MDLPIPVAVKAIAARLEEAGFETWAVGGGVRDSLLGQSPQDWDLATAAHPRQVRKLFPRTVPIGIEHGTVGVLDDVGVMHEVTTFRRDVETTGRHAVVEFADRVEEDLARRDFTINAIAWHPLRGELFDPFGGERDLEARRLRTVGSPQERFAEDYLRVLRALRFAGQLDMDIDPQTWEALPAAAPRLPSLSGERVREELWKVLEKSRRPSRALDLYREAGALEVLYPELAALVGLRESDADADVWTRSLGAADALPPSRPLLRLAALLHGVGMPPARSRDLRGGYRFTGHPTMAERPVRAIMERLRASNAHTEKVVRLVALQEHLFPPDADGAMVRRWLRDVGPSLVNDLFRLRIALHRARSGDSPAPDLVERWRLARAVLRQRPPLQVGDLAIGGAQLRGLGLRPGPEFGRILGELLELVIERPELNTEGTLLERVRERWVD